MDFRYLPENNKAVKLTPIRNGGWYFTEYLSKDGDVIGSNNSPSYFYDGDSADIPTIQYKSFTELKQSHPHIYSAVVSATSVSRVNWTKELALSINYADINGIIKVETDTMVELGNRAASRMCPEKHIRFVTEWPLNY